MDVNLQARQVTFVVSLVMLLVAKPLCAHNAQRASSSDEARCQDPEALQSALEHTWVLIERIRAASYPELNAAQIQVRTLESSSDFFRVRPRILDFFVKKKLRYVIRVNPRVFELKVPGDGVEAIVAHELSHVAYLKKRNRLRLLAMVRLLCRGFARTFERRADLEAVSRGYGPGLKAYRQWLYQHIPPNSLVEKRRNYFSPEEIDFMLLSLRRCPSLLDAWIKKPQGASRKLNASFFVPGRPLSQNVKREAKFHESLQFNCLGVPAVFTWPQIQGDCERSFGQRRSLNRLRYTVARSSEAASERKETLLQFRSGVCARGRPRPFHSLGNPSPWGSNPYPSVDVVL
jgi:hypothetical protein